MMMVSKGLFNYDDNCSLTYYLQELVKKGKNKTRHYRDIITEAFFGSFFLHARVTLLYSYIYIYIYIYRMYCLYRNNISLIDTYSIYRTLMWQVDKISKTARERIDLGKALCRASEKATRPQAAAKAKAKAAAKDLESTKDSKGSS